MADTYFDLNCIKTMTKCRKTKRRNVKERASLTRIRNHLLKLLVFNVLSFFLASNVLFFDVLSLSLHLHIYEHLKIIIKKHFIFLEWEIFNNFKTKLTYDFLIIPLFWTLLNLTPTNMYIVKTKKWLKRHSAHETERRIKTKQQTRLPAMCFSMPIVLLEVQI